MERLHQTLAFFSQSIVLGFFWLKFHVFLNSFTEALPFICKCKHNYYNINPFFFLISPQIMKGLNRQLITFVDPSKCVIPLVPLLFYLHFLNPIKQPLLQQHTRRQNETFDIAHFIAILRKIKSSVIYSFSFHQNC